MSKPYSVDDLSDQITSDRTWRIKEISDLKSSIYLADVRLKRVLFRALIALGYAHWEGHIKTCANIYMKHISIKKSSLSELNRQFIKNHFLPRLAVLSSQKVSVEERCRIIDDIIDYNNNKFSRIHPDLINTKSNLNFDTLKDICIICDIDYSYFESLSDFIDVRMLKRRNSIAHGENAFIELDEVDSFADTVIALMREFGDRIENNAYQKSYLTT